MMKIFDKDGKEVTPEKVKKVQRKKAYVTIKRGFCFYLFLCKMKRQTVHEED